MKEKERLYKEELIKKIVRITQTVAHNDMNSSIFDLVEEYLEGPLREVDHLNEFFNLQHQADLRALKMWQEKTGKELTIPDRTDMVLFLLSEIDQHKNSITDEGKGVSAIVLQIGNRFFSKYENKRLVTAWSIAGAELFGEWRIEDVERVEKILIQKGYKPIRRTVCLKRN